MKAKLKRLRDEMSSAVSAIVGEYLEGRFGRNVEHVKTLVTGNLLITHVPTLPAPKNETRSEQARDPFWFQRLFENMLRPSENEFRERLMSLLKRPIGKIHYVVGVQGKDMDIVIHLGTVS